MSIANLAAQIEERRTELGWTQRDLSIKSGVSLTTISAIEREARTTFQTTTLTSLDRALGWPLGHSGAVLRGDVPAENLILTSRADSAALQRLYELAALLDDEAMSELIVEAQRLRDGSPRTIHFDGEEHELDYIVRDDASIKVTLIEAKSGTRWMRTRVDTGSTDQRSTRVTYQELA